MKTTKNFTILVIVWAVIFTANMVYGTPIGTYECSDFSSSNRELAIGSGIDAGDIVSIGGFDALQLSGDSEYIKTVSGIPGFTNGSDWSWMAIVRSDQLTNYRVFMRGKAWEDKIGDFDLRLGPNATPHNTFTWQRAPIWRDSDGYSADVANNKTDLLWVAGTYDYDLQKYYLYVNGNLLDSYDRSPMNDGANTNPLNINGQWANNNHSKGNVYVEGSFTFAQLILSQSLYSQSALQTCYANGIYMTADSDTWLDIRVENTSAPVPEPNTIILLCFGLLGLVGFSKRFKI